MTVEKTAAHGRFWLIKFIGVETREEASRYRGALIQIPLRDRMPLPEDSFYHDQLVGLQVFSTDEKLLGHIIDIVLTGGHDLLLVEQTEEEGKHIMIPAVKEYVRIVDLRAGKIIVALPEGFLEL